MRLAKFPRVLLLAVLLCWLLSGCATKLPQTTPLSPGQQQEAENLLTAFFQVPRPAAVDADVRLGWDVFGSKGGVDAHLQLQQPAFLRFSADDPLGRSLLLAVSDGAFFTLVDNRIGRIYQGKIDSKFWRSYIPQAIVAEDLFYFLGGLLPNVDMKATGAAQDPERTGFWYVWKDGGALTHHVLLDRRSKEMTRHLLFDPRGDLILEMTYSGYRGAGDSGFNWPRHLQMKGSAITGTLTVQVKKIYSHRPLAAATFFLEPPGHFTVEQVP